MLVDAVGVAILRQGIPTVGSEAYADFLAVVLAPTCIGILTRFGSFGSVGLQLRGEPLLNTTRRDDHALAAKRFLLFLVRLLPLVMEHLNTEHIGYMLDSFGISLVVKAHNEVYGISVDSATETVIGVSRGAYNERRITFIVEGATAHKVRPGLLQRDIIF